MIKITKEIIKTTPFLKSLHEGDYLDVDSHVYRVMADGTVKKYTSDGGWSTKDIPERVQQQLRWLNGGRIS